jgi:hypothetical protein
VTDFKETRLPDRKTLIRNAIETEFFGGGEWRVADNPDPNGARCHVTRIWGRPPRKAVA